MKIAWIFPGQGAQAAGMGQSIAAASPAAAAVFERADAAFGASTCGASLSRLCFEGPLAELTLTENTQPAIVATSMALVAALRERCPDRPPACAAGHSLGEYSALCAAGAISLQDAIRVTRARGKAMQDAVPPGKGAMAAVLYSPESPLDDDALAAICLEVSARVGAVSPANFNAPGQTVIAGTAEAVEEAGRSSKERGGKVIGLNVSAPFHCALMESAQARLAGALANASLKAPAFDVLANVDAEARRDEQALVDALVRQVTSPVQWVKTIQAMRARGVTHLFEIGPGKVLAGLCKRIDKALVVVNVSDPAGVQEAAALAVS